MRIGILTFHRSYNYGAFLQCYSLVQQLKKDFPYDQIEVIDYMFDDNLGYRQALKKASPKEREVILKRNASIESVISYLPLSKKRIIDSNYHNLYEQIMDDYDIIVVGSDAVFNWNGKGLPNAFMPVDICYKGKMLSYAASAHGIDYLSCNKDLMDKAQAAFRRFEFLGVRDDTTARLITFSSPGLCPIHTCDPTVLLNLDELPVDMDLLKNKLERRGISFNKPIVGIMAGEHVGKGIRNAFAGGVQTVAVYKTNKYAQYFLDDLNPFEWARVFSFFDVTVTHFFHGTMFSLKNERPTVVVERIGAYQKKYTTKVHDLLNRLNLAEFYFPCEIETKSMIQKGMYKLCMSGGKYRSQLNKQISGYIANGLPENYISSRLNIERESYQSFYHYLESIRK